VFEGRLVIFLIHVGVVEAVEAAGVIPGRAEKFGGHRESGRGNNLAGLNQVRARLVTQMFSRGGAGGTFLGVGLTVGLARSLQPAPTCQSIFCQTRVS
jgi:hypothetical protein